MILCYTTISFAGITLAFINHGGNMILVIGEKDDELEGVVKCMEDAHLTVIYARDLGGAKYILSAAKNTTRHLSVVVVLPGVTNQEQICKICALALPDVPVIRKRPDE